MDNTTHCQTDLDRSKMNKEYLETLRSHFELEIDFLHRDSNHPAIIDGLKKVIETIIETVDTITHNAANLNATELIRMFLNSANSLAGGGILSPITGFDEEWEDITNPDDVGAIFKSHCAGIDFEVKIESIQVNKRFPKIFRLNNDNRLAHNTEFLTFQDSNDTNRVVTNDDSVRFIQFPYILQNIVIPANIDDEHESINLLTVTADDIEGFAFLNEYNTPLFAPKIPLYALIEGGFTEEDIRNKLDSLLKDEDIDFSNEVVYDDICGMYCLQIAEDVVKAFSKINDDDLVEKLKLDSDLNPLSIVLSDSVNKFNLEQLPSYKADDAAYWIEVFNSDKFKNNVLEFIRTISDTEAVKLLLSNEQNFECFLKSVILK